MTVGWRAAIRLGLGLILAGSAWYGGWAWRADRLETSGAWRPLDIQVSLAVGQLRIPEIEIKVASTYFIEAELLATWRLRSGNRIVAQGESQPNGYISGRFTVAEGRYLLELDIQQLPSWHGVRPPRLMIFEMGGKREAAWGHAERAFWIGLLCVAAGLYVIVRHAIHRHLEVRDAAIRDFPLTGVGPQPPVFGAVSSTTVRTLHRPQGATTPALSLLRLRQSSLVVVLGLLLITVSVWVLQILQETKHYAGLNVRLVPRLSPRSSVGVAPVLVYVDAKHGVYVDSQPVAWNALDAAVREAVANRPLHWPVFVDAAGGLEVQWPVSAMDVIRGIGLEVAMAPRATAAGP
jgi:biopolymer transport protein ExbD